MKESRIFSNLRERGFVILRAMGLHRPQRKDTIWLKGASLCDSPHTFLRYTNTTRMCMDRLCSLNNSPL